MKNTTYALPNDEEEIQRLNLNFVCRSILGASIIAPISPEPTNILDAGTGSGAWCIDVATQFPKARVLRIDLSPIQPENGPTNCEFLVADLNDGLKFPDERMDLVHSRFGVPKLTHC